jgi:ATP:ADP antiporter, AAA family
VKTSRNERALAYALGLLAKVEPQEVVTTGLMTLATFVLMSGYYLVKTAREPLILLHWGAETKLYIEAAQALILVGVVRAYSAIAARVGRMKLLAIVYLFFASNMFVFAGLAKMKLAIGFAFFLWVGIFSYTSIAQFWAFAADIFTEEQGKRLFAVIGVGSSVGAVAGSALARSLVSRGAPVLILGAAGAVVICVGLLVWIERRARVAAQGTGATPRAVEEPVASKAPLRLLLADRYLILIGGLTLAVNCVSGLGDYVVDRTLLAHVASARLAGGAAEAFVGSFKAGFFAWYNLLGLLLQAFAVSRILARIRIRGALLVLPLTAFLGYGTFVFAPALAVIRLVVIANRALDYSLTNTSRHALFLVATRAEKYVGKTLVDTVGARSGDLVSAAVVWFAFRARMPPTAIAAACVIIASGWILIVLGIGRENERRLARAEPEQALALNAREATPAYSSPR